LIKTAVIIAGGEGSRLKPLTNDTHKTLIQVNGKPLLFWIIQWLRTNGITNIVLGVAYRKEKIIDYVERNNYFGMEVKFSNHSVEGGTAEAFNHAARYVEEDDFVAMNCDELTNMNLMRMYEKHIIRRPMVTMAVTPFEAKFSVVKLDQTDVVESFIYGHKIPEAPVSIGIYIFSKDVVKYIPSFGSIEDLVFAKLAENGQIVGHMLGESEQWVTINNQKELFEAERIMSGWNYVKNMSVSSG
jgi:NDP-sugar pyrophosphorylase family protein